MAWQQLIPFDKNKAGKVPYWCLRNTRKGFGIAAKHPTAIEAWKHTEQHTDAIPVAKDVPLFYSFLKKGHVNVRRKDGTVWSDGKLYWSLDQFLAKNKRCKYLGWGESINGVRVLKYVKPKKPVIAMPSIDSLIELTPTITRTTFRGSKSVGKIKVTKPLRYWVRGHKKNRVVINSKSGGGKGVELALYYTNGKRIRKWKVLRKK